MHLTPSSCRHTRTVVRLYQHRYSSTHGRSTSLLKITDIPAPHRGSIRIVSLNRPKARNAISIQLLAELREQIDSIHKEQSKGPTRALILASEVDASFCAGADLKERATFTPEQFVTSSSSQRLRCSRVLQGSH